MFLLLQQFQTIGLWDTAAEVRELNRVEGHHLHDLSQTGWLSYPFDLHCCWSLRSTLTMLEMSKTLRKSFPVTDVMSKNISWDLKSDSSTPRQRSECQSVLHLDNIAKPKSWATLVSGWEPEDCLYSHEPKICICSKALTVGHALPANNHCWNEILYR